MSQYYTAKRTRNVYDPTSSEPYYLSRFRLDVYRTCPRCFYLDRRLGTDRPGGFPFTLNNAVDALLKKEFDGYRERGEAHPLIIEYGLDAVPAQHEKLDDWRNNRKGVQYLHEQTNLLLAGAIDDLWISSQGEYMVVDYKATSKNKHITELDEDWQIGYKRQMEFYQWLVRKNGLTVSDAGYFVYCNGITERDAFNKRLDFDITLVPHIGDDSWVEPTILEVYKCLNSDTIPQAGEDCDFCAYRDEVTSLFEKGFAKSC